MGQMGKWYTNVSDFRKGQQMQKNQPVFRKLLASGSVEEEALNLLIHDKKVREMEKELQEMLNARFGYKTWDELKQLQRKIRADRQKQIYDAAERRQAFINTVAIVLLLGAMICTFTALMCVNTMLNVLFDSTEIMDIVHRCLLNIELLHTVSLSV